MPRRWPIVLLLVGAVGLLVSLYLPWQETSSNSTSFFGRGGDVNDLLNALGGPRTINGWSSTVGQAAELSALLMVGFATFALARPQLVRVLPLGQCALFVAYFGLAIGVETRSIAHRLAIGHFHYAYGAYLGLAAAMLVLLAGGVARREEAVRHRSASQLAASILAVGLLGAFLLPWLYGAPVEGIAFPGIDDPPIVIAAAITLSLLAVWWPADSGPRTERLVLSAAAVLFIGAGFSVVRGYSYGAWIALGLAIALVALALLDGAQVLRPARPPRLALATGAIATLFVASLFLPWWSVCDANGRDCFSTNGWWSGVGPEAAALAITLAFATLAPRRLNVFAIELAAGVVLLVATVGFQLNDVSAAQFAYGSTIGFASAGLLAALAVMRLRTPAFEWNRALVRLVPMGACAAYLVLVVLTWWHVFPVHSALVVAPLSWLSIAGALLGIRLLHLWARRIARMPGNPEWLVLLPLALLALAAVDPVRRYARWNTWGLAIVVGLCLLLIWLGRVEQREGLENARVPEILRVDRL
jgi:hypothetical protein